MDEIRRLWKLKCGGPQPVGNGQEPHFVQYPSDAALGFADSRSPLRKLQTLFKLWRHQYDGYAIPGVACDIDYSHNIPNVQAGLTLHIDDSVGASAEFRSESGAFGPDGNLYVVDSASPGAVTKLNGTTGALISELTGGDLSDPEGITFGPDGNLYVANGNDIVRFNGVTGAFMGIFVTAGSGGLSGGRHVTFGPDGNLYATSSGTTGGVLKYNGTTGAFLGAFVGPGGDLSLPRGLTFGPDGNLYVANFGGGNVDRFNGATGAFLDTFIAAGSGPPPGSGTLGGPTFLLFHEQASSVPEPSTLALIGLSLAGLVMWRRRRN